MHWPRLIPPQRGTRSQVRLAESEPATAGSLAPSAARRAWARVPAVLLLIGGLWVFVRLLTDARFRVDAVEIHGLQHLPADRIAEMVEVTGQSICTVPAQALADRIAARYGCVDRVEVRCRLPNQVTVTVWEKDVAAVWQSGERYWWLGPEGEVLGEAEDPGDLVVIRDVAGMAPEPQGYVPGAPVALVRALDQVLAANRVYDYTEERGLVVYVTSAGWPVYLGREGDAARKVAIMRALVNDLVSRSVGVEFIDLRNERRPTYKPG